MRRPTSAALPRIADTAGGSMNWPACDHRVSLQLAHRSVRYGKKIEKLSISGAALAFGDVGGNGNGCSPYLSGETIALLGRNHCRFTIDLLHQVHRALPGEQTLIVLSGHEPGRCQRRATCQGRCGTVAANLVRLLPTAYCILHTAYRLLHTAYRIPPTAYRLLLLDSLPCSMYFSSFDKSLTTSSGR
jgi:hypothetical protein